MHLEMQHRSKGLVHAARQVRLNVSQTNVHVPRRVCLEAVYSLAAFNWKAYATRLA